MEAAPATAAPRLLQFNGDLKSARIVDAATIEFTYQSGARAIAITDRPAVKVEIDGEAVPVVSPLMLPRGQHLVRVTCP